MFKVNVICPHEDCKKSLMDHENLVSNQPSIHLRVKKGDVEGDLYLSSIYGDYNSIDPEKPHYLNGDCLEFYCPHCGKELPVIEKCSCGADTKLLHLQDGGKLKFCSRKGCNYHNISFEKSEDLYKFLDDN
ncbi:MAG: hypothetical protein ACLFSQ_00850 [Candidatus Zixiibacteriota bacterium]